MLDKPFSFHSKVIWAFTVAQVFLMSLSFPAWAAPTKGIQVVIKDRQGKDVGLYKGSYALLIGASRYKGGWPSLTSVPHEIKTVKDVLEKAYRAELFYEDDPSLIWARPGETSFLSRHLQIAIQYGDMYAGAIQQPQSKRFFLFGRGNTPRRSWSFPGRGRGLNRKIFSFLETP